MKNLLKITLAIMLFFATFTTAQAQSLGLQVLTIPKGTAAHYVDQGGKKFKYIFKGKVGKLYMIKVSGSRRYERFYNAQGMLVKISEQGFSVKYLPFFCDRKPGDCSFTFDAEYSKYDGKWTGRLKKSKGGYQYVFGRIKNKSDRPLTVFMKFGKYNFLEEYVSGSNWFRLQKITVAK